MPACSLLFVELPDSFPAHARLGTRHRGMLDRNAPHEGKRPTRRCLRTVASREHTRRRPQCVHSRLVGDRCARVVASVRERSLPCRHKHAEPDRPVRLGVRVLRAKPAIPLPDKPMVPSDRRPASPQATEVPSRRDVPRKWDTLPRCSLKRSCPSAATSSIAAEADSASRTRSSAVLIRKSRIAARAVTALSVSVMYSGWARCAPHSRRGGRGRGRFLRQKLSLLIAN